MLISLPQHSSNVRPVRSREQNSLNEPPRPILKKNFSIVQLLTNGNYQIRPNTSGTRRIVSLVNIMEEPLESNCNFPMEKKAKRGRMKEVPMLSLAEVLERRRKVQESTDRARRTFMNHRHEALRQLEKGENGRVRDRLLSC